MKAFVDDAEIETVKKSLEASPEIAEALGKDWIDENFLKKEERTKRHPKFWIFLDQSKSKMIEDWLSTLKTRLPRTKFTKNVNSLKGKRGENEFYSYIPEIEVFSYYKKQENGNFKVEFEPPIPGKTRIGDVKLTIGSIPVFLEVTRLFSSAEEERISNIIGAVHQKIDALEGNPFLISFGLEEHFQETDIDPFVRFVSHKIYELRDVSEESDIKPIQVTFENKAWLIFLKDVVRHGHVVGDMTPVMRIESAGGLKNKALEEVKQLPDDQFSVIVLDISHIFAHFDDVEDMFAGQIGVKIDITTTEATPFRHANGFVEMNQGKTVGAVIAFKRFDHENRKKYVNLSAKHPFTNDMVSKT